MLSLGSETDAEMRRQAEVGLSGATELMQVIARDLHSRHVLLPGLSPERAGDMLLALCSPQMHRLLTHHRGWTSSEYRSWLATSLQAALLRSEAQSSGNARPPRSERSAR